MVAFRGAVPLINWIQLFKFYKQKVPLCSGCEVHHGVWKSYLTIREQVLSGVRALVAKHPLADITVTGHSMGGALAAICSLDIINNIRFVQSLITFASLRTGNQAFATAINSLIPNVQRVVHYRDPVPHLPGQSFGYIHYSPEVWYNEKMDHYVECPGAENKDCSDSVHFYQWKPGDHGTYLGVPMDCKGHD